MRMLVTGGAGFLGSVIAKKLLDDGHEVWVLDNLMYGGLINILGLNGVEFLEHDVREKATWDNLLEFGFDIVYHFASPSSITLFKEDFNDCAQNTMQGFLNALDFCYKTGAKLVYPSTGSLYSGVKDQHEFATIQYQNLNEYAKCKYNLELMSLSYHDKVDTLAFRIFATYGENERHKGRFASVVHMFARDILQDKSPVIWGDGNQTRDFIYQDDIAKLVTDLSYDNKRLKVNLGSGVSVSFNEIVKIINEITGKNIVPEYVDKPLNYLETTCANMSLLKEHYYNIDKELEITSLRAGITKMLENIHV